MDPMQPSKKFYRYAKAAKNHPNRLFRIQKQIVAPSGWKQQSMTIWIHVCTAGDTLNIKIYYREQHIFSDARLLSDVWQHAEMSPYRYIECWWEELTEKVRQVVGQAFGAC